METKNITQQWKASGNNGKHGKLNNSAALGAAAVAGGVVGTAGMDAVNEYDVADTAETETATVRAKDTPKQPESVSKGTEAVSKEPEPVSMEQETVVDKEDVTVEHETVSEEQNVVSMEPEGVAISTEENADVTVESESVNLEEVTEDIQEPIVSQAPTDDDTDVSTEEQPDYDIVDDIIAGEEIDPNDIDMADVINVDSVGTVYTVDGQSMAAAAIHDKEGNELLMVDVDGGGFDVIVTPEGDVVAEIEGDIDVSDAEHMMTDEAGGYLAANDFDESLNADSDMEDDIIEV